MDYHHNMLVAPKQKEQTSDPLDKESDAEVNALHWPYRFWRCVLDLCGQSQCEEGLEDNCWLWLSKQCLNKFSVHKAANPNQGGTYSN